MNTRPTTFKVGQRIRCVEGSGHRLSEGRIYTVKGFRTEDGESYVDLTEDSPGDSGWWIHRFRPVTKADQGKPLTLRELQEQLPWTIHYHHDFRASPMAHKDFEHGLIHVFKAAGKLASVVNDAEHKGSTFSAAEVDPYIADLVICALRLANTVPDRKLDLQSVVEDRIETKNQVKLKRGKK